MDIKKRLFSKEPSNGETLVKVKNGLYKYGKITIRVTSNEPSDEAIASFNAIYNEVISGLIK
ncbi:hypothetical protein [Desulfosporosinus sp. BG]|uniref:hypothetical protein n=1 Tax=Desulfosporosinus sp. BG TaxID=1633135 RepID=UPI00083A2510|nr:hypothetical protein [Desulfosporosinus sp. BG]ODA41231.1 hypothetical protein DSBG_2002 [Desulfosporosinus sp. BG]